MKRFLRAFRVFEHVTILVTALAALVTIVQYWSERNQRAANHLSATLERYLSCQDLVRFSLTQEKDPAHRFGVFIVDYEEAIVVCDAAKNELNYLMREARMAELANLPTAEEAREMLRRAVPANTPPDF